MISQIPYKLRHKNREFNIRVRKYWKVMVETKPYRSPEVNDSKYSTDKHKV